MTRLGKMLHLYFSVFGGDQAKAAEEIGISASTLTRIKAGKMPDADGMVRLMLWLLGPQP